METARQACLEKLREVAALPADEGVIDRCMAFLRKHLASSAKGEALCDTVEQLLRAGNAPRAIKLLEEIPLSAPRTGAAIWAAVLIFAMAAFAGGLFLVITPKVAPAGPVLVPTSGAIERAEAEVTDLTTAFVDNLSNGRVAAAYAQMSAPYRAVVSPSRFQTAVAANPLIVGATGGAISHMRFETGTAETRGSLVPAGAAGPVLFKASYGRDPAGWRLTGFTVGNVPVLPQGPP